MSAQFGGAVASAGPKGRVGPKVVTGFACDQREKAVRSRDYVQTKAEAG